MDTMMGFVALIITSLVALFAALALDWILLRGMFLLMQPWNAARSLPHTRSSLHQAISSEASPQD